MCRLLPTCADGSQAACPSLDLPSSAEDTCAACGDEPNLRSRRGRTVGCGRVADVLVITTTVRILDWVHCTATDLGPAIALHPVLVEVVSSLEHWLVHAATACHDADNCAACRWDRLAR